MPGACTVSKPTCHRGDDGAALASAAPGMPSCQTEEEKGFCSGVGEDLVSSSPWEPGSTVALGLDYTVMCSGSSPRVPSHGAVVPPVPPPVTGNLIAWVEV